MITIRKATIQDAKHISSLGKKTFDQSFGHLFKNRGDLVTYLDETFSEEKIVHSLNKAHNKYWLVLEGAFAIGYAKLQLQSTSEFVDSEKVCKLQRIYFLKDYVSKGIGSKLHDAVFAEGSENESEYIWLSVLKENKKAITFYERYNYTIIGEHPFTIGSQKFDFWVMARKLK